ncbi:Chromate transporter [compost metagenome]
MAAYLGYQQRGVLGAIIAVIAHILPSSIAMIALLSMVRVLSTSPIVAGMIGAVTPVIAVMLGTMAYEFGEKAIKGLGKYMGVGLFIVSLLMLQWIDIHPGLVIILFLAYGAVHFRLVTKLKARRQQKGGSSS